MTHNEIFVILYTKDVNNSMTEPKKFTDALKDALAKKQAAQHPDAKKSKNGKTKRSGAMTCDEGLLMRLLLPS